MTISRVRLDALTDGVFAVVMTLLVIDIKLPETAHAATPREALELLAAIDLQFLVYALSFAVIAVRWMSLARAETSGETVTPGYTRLALLHLFLISCIPFSTSFVGRFGNLAPPVMLYAANLLLAAAAAIPLLPKTHSTGASEPAASRNLGAVILLSLLVMIASPFLQAQALWLYVLTAVPVQRWRRKQ